MKRVLVTGATGFIGRHALPALLERGYDVHAVARRPGTATGIRWHAADLLDAAQAAAVLRAARPSHLLHLAWYAEHGKFWTSPENARWVDATRALLGAFQAIGGRRAVLAGSCAEYDWHGNGRCNETTTPLRPATVYGTCKNAAREQFDAWRAATGVSGAWGRIFHAYGPHEHPDRLVAFVARALLQDQDAPCTAGTQLRDFLHAADVAGAFVALLDSDVEGAVNIGSGSQCALADVAGRIAALTGRPQRLRLGARPIPAGDPPRLVPVTERLRHEVGWRPRYDLDEGLRLTVDWWREQIKTNGAST